MKKNFLLILPSVITVFVLGYLVYSHYLWGRVVSIQDVTKEERITLVSKEKMINNFHFHLTGQLDGEAFLSWDCANFGSDTFLAERCLDQERLLPGKIDIERGSDWYDQGMFLKYQPSSTVKSGHLQIRYSL